jgi:hypothetical protein
MASKLPLTGGCQCGACRYEITAEPLGAYTCHCTACQNHTGSAFSMAVLVDEAAFRMTRGTLKPIERKGDSGRTVTRLVCPDCGSWICNGPRPDGRRVRVGTLDDTSWVKPTMHFWTRSKQPWIVLPEGDQVFETQPG